MACGGSHVRFLVLPSEWLLCFEYVKKTKFVIIEEIFEYQLFYNILASFLTSCHVTKVLSYCFYTTQDLAMFFVGVP